MAHGIDHLVVAVADPEAAAAELGERLGLAFTAGGRHPGSGTVNRIAFLGDAYLELIGVEDPGLASRTPLGAAVIRALDAGGGLATYALADEQLDASVASLRAAGSSIGPVVRGSRHRDDGERVEWSTAMFDTLGPDRPPFLIRHVATGVEWSAAALAERAAQVHPIGSPVRLVRLDLATDDPAGLAAELAAQLHLEVWAVADLAIVSIGPHAIRLVPSREMPVPAIAVLAASVEAPRSVEALGMRLDVEAVEFLDAVAEPSRRGVG
ncbi:MAG: VOC family protein [Candidatus Limnocylindria bacterium]